MLIIHFYPKMKQPNAICVDVSTLLACIWGLMDDNARRLYNCTFNLSVIQNLMEDVFCVVVVNKVPLPQEYGNRAKILYPVLTACVRFEYMSTFSSSISIYLEGTSLLIVEENHQ
jgi:hypothetical protein